MFSAAICARMSPSTLSGTRTFFSMIAKIASLGAPRSYSFSVGMRSPSWYTSTESVELLPGTIPPTSVWCATVAAKPWSSSSTKTGLMT